MHGGDHIARNSPVAPNGSHSLSNPVSHAAPQAVKSRFEQFKDALYGR